jgi:uncharacterized membrane protein
MAAQSIYQQQLVPARQARLDQVMHKAGVITLEYWPHAITVVLGIIVFAALSVPVLTYLGLYAIAKPIFFSLHLICAQIPSHSFYILGHQLGMCARNMGIYGSMFIGGLVFVLSKKRVPGIPWWAWLLLILPMAYDGLTQMFGLRESTWELRVLTGALFGFGNMWFALPFIQRTLKEMMVVPASSPYVQPAPAAQALPAGSAQSVIPAQRTAPITRPLFAQALNIQADPDTPLPASATQTSHEGADEDTMPLQEPTVLTSDAE